MGVDFFPCSNDECDEVICDAGPWWDCELCGNCLCESCEKSLVHTEIDHDGDEIEICPFCEKTVINNDDLLVFAMWKLGMTREQLIEAYKEAK